MLDRIRGQSDILVTGILAKPAVYTRMRAFVRSKVPVSDSCRQALSLTTEDATKRNVLLVYNRVYDRANLGDENAIRLLGDITHVTGIGITLNGQHIGPEVYKPVAQAA